MSIKKYIRKILPSRVTSHRIVTGLLRGDFIVTSWHDYPAAILGYTERNLLSWLNKNVFSGETWVDIGAHYGYISIFLSKRVGKNGKVIAFEPSLSTAGYLSQTKYKNHLEQLMIIPMGLSDINGIKLVKLPVTRGMVDNTIGTFNFTESIILTKFDHLWPQIAKTDPNIDGIKIDVQGMELHVLRGMKNALRSFKPKLVVELHMGVDRIDFKKELIECGYSSSAYSIENGNSFEDFSELEDNVSYAFYPL